MWTAFHHVQPLEDKFWTEFRCLYLPLLNHRHKWLGSEPNLCVGDLVMVIDDSQLRRHCWSLAKLVLIATVGFIGLLLSEVFLLPGSMNMTSEDYVYWKLPISVFSFCMFFVF